MTGLRTYLLAGAAAAFLALAGALWWQSGRVAALRDANTLLRASVASLELERDLAREAQAVADAYRAASEAKAKEYDQLREGLLRDENDSDLPAWFAAYLERLLGQHDNEVGQPIRPE